MLVVTSCLDWYFQVLGIILKELREHTQTAKQQVLFKEIVQDTLRGSSGPLGLECPKDRALHGFRRRS